MRPAPKDPKGKIKIVILHLFRAPRRRRHRRVKHFYTFYDNESTLQSEGHPAPRHLCREQSVSLCPSRERSKELDVAEARRFLPLRTPHVPKPHKMCHIVGPISSDNLTCTLKIFSVAEKCDVTRKRALLFGFEEVQHERHHAASLYHPGRP